MSIVLTIASLAVFSCIDSTAWIPDQFLYLYGIAVIRLDIKTGTKEKGSIHHYSFRSIFSSRVSDLHQRTGTDAAKRHFRIGGIQNAGEFVSRISFNCN